MERAHPDIGDVNIKSFGNTVASRPTSKVDAADSAGQHIPWLIFVLNYQYQYTISYIIHLLYVHGKTHIHTHTHICQQQNVISQVYAMTIKANFILFIKIILSTSFVKPKLNLRS